MALPLTSLWSVLGKPVHYFTKAHRAVYGGVVDTPEQLEKIVVNANKMHSNAYVHINSVSTANMKGCASDVVAWDNVLIDIDPSGNDPEPDLALDNILSYLITLFGEDEYITVIHSGRGRQIWLRLNSPAVFSDEDRRRFEATTATFLRALDKYAAPYGCMVDTSCSDLSRVARLPGNINTKTGRPATLLGVATKGIDASMFMREFYTTLPERKVFVKLADGEKLCKVLPHLTDLAGQFIVSGIRSSGRHSAAVAVGASLAECGVDKGIAVKWLLQGAERCTPTLDPEEAMRAFENGWRKHEVSKGSVGSS